MTAAGRRPRRPRLVTLATDLGTAYAAQMKAVLLAALPPDRIVDLTHELRPHDIAEAAFVLREIHTRLPPGAVHVVVVDPGVGGRRRPIAIACGDGSALVGPDNGVLAPLATLHGGGRAYTITNVRPGAERVGTTFDGRDVFAPAAAQLALGRPARELGPRQEPAPLPVPGPHREADGARGAVAHVDRFGNLVTNVPTAWLPTGRSTVKVGLGGRTQRLPVHRSYEAAGGGTRFVLGSSFGTLEVAVAEGRASDRGAVRAGTPVRFGWEARRSGPPRRKRK